MSNVISTPNYYEEAIDAGYIFECSCGEIYRTAAGAQACRKCREYLMEDDFDSRTVTDIRSGLIVWAAWGYNRELPPTRDDVEAAEREARAEAHEAALLEAATRPVESLTFNPFGSL